MDEVDDDDDDDDDDLNDDQVDDAATIMEVASFTFDGPPVIGGVSDNAVVPTTAAAATTKAEDGAIPLPDIKDTLRRKELEARMAQMEAEQESQKPKIDRKDRQALLKVRFCLFVCLFVYMSVIGTTSKAIFICTRVESS
jgi:hypothetical protein